MKILVLHPPPEETTVDKELNLNLDIVVVHGLNGDREKTWTEAKSKKFWPRDFLPGDLPNARIMTFGYSAKWVGNTTAGIIEHARDLLNDLAEVRKENSTGVDATKRPLLFIGHSLGGLVIKQALIFAHKDRANKSIYISTCGVAFFGTPHQGSSLADLGELLARILITTLANLPPPELLNALKKKGNERLKLLMAEFKTLLDLDDFTVASFYETRCLPLFNSLVVEKESALITAPGEALTYEKQFPVDSDHREMCRFATPENETYRYAVNCIKEMQQSGSGGIDVKNEYYVVPHAASTYFTGRDDIRTQLSERLVLDRGSSAKFQRRSVLYGLGGSGKTQMCLKFAQDHREKFWGIFWIDATSNTTAEESIMKIASVCKKKSPLPLANPEDVREWLTAQDHWLLIFDNADDLNFDISTFFPRGTKGTILVTTRLQKLKFLSSPRCSIEVDKMTQDDAVSLLFKTAELGVDKAEQKRLRPAAEAVVKILGFLALGIISAGATIRTGAVSLEEFCESWGKQNRKLLEECRPISSIDYPHSIYTTWEMPVETIENMKEAHARLALEILRYIPFLHFQASLESIFEAAITNARIMPLDNNFQRTELVHLMANGWNAQVMGDAIKLLDLFSLITLERPVVNGSHRISIHPLVHEWATCRMSEEARYQAWKGAVSTIAMSMTGDWDTQNLQRRKALLPHIDVCLSFPEYQLLAEGLDLEDRFLAALKFALVYRESFRSTSLDLSLQCQELAKSKFPQHYYAASFELAGAYSNIARNKQALEIRLELLSIEREHRNPVGIAESVYWLAEQYIGLGEHQKAVDVCDKTMEEFKDIMDESWTIMITLLETKGSALLEMDKLKDAIKCFEDVMQIRKRRDPNEECFRAIEQLAGAYWRLGKRRKARKFHEQFVILLEQKYGPDDLRTAYETARLEDYRYTTRTLISSPRRRAKGISATRKRYDEFRKRGEVNVVTINCMDQLARDYFVCGKIEMGIQMMEEVVALMVEKYGPDYHLTICYKRVLKRWQRLYLLRKCVYWWVPKRFFNGLTIPE